MRRRNFLKSTPVGLGALLAIKTVLSQQTAEAPRIRESITKFSTDPQKVNELRSAVKAMKLRKATDPESWRFWAAVHQYPVDDKDLKRQGFPQAYVTELQPNSLWTAPPQIKAAWYKCSHSFDPEPEAGIHFLSWHRIYLFYFERVLRYASSQKNLSLPYWNQISDPKLPDIFRKIENNSLYTALRDPNINNGASVAGLNYSALAATDMFNSIVHVDGAPLRGFSHGIEQNTHNAGHGAISGLMAHPYTAALDPIFWLHHANVDRLWKVWLHAHPASNDASIVANWLATQFSFYDFGKPTDVQVERFLKDDLGYIYDDETLPIFDEVKTPELPIPKKILKGTKPPQEASQGNPRYGKFSLGNDPMSILLPLTKADQRDLQSVSRAKKMDGNKSKLLLVLSGVRLGKDALKYGFKFDVYLTLPDSSGNNKLGAKRSKIGSFGPFELACQSVECGAKGHVLKFELNPTIQAQLENRDVLPDNAFVSFVREGARDDNKNLISLPQNTALIEVTSLSLERSE
jgi:tyrosinase